jgi:hypothetical protein
MIQILKKIGNSYPVLQVLFRFEEVKHKQGNLCQQFAEVMKSLE